MSTKWHTTSAKHKAGKAQRASSQARVTSLIENTCRCQIFRADILFYLEFCADEQGLGKTVQAIALIVMEVPSRANAEAALADAQREQNMMALHPESAEARAARAAGIGIFPAGACGGSASASGDASPGTGLHISNMH